MAGAPLEDEGLPRALQLIVLEWGLRYERAFIEWLDWAEAEAKRARRSRGLSSKQETKPVRARRAAQR
jgi:hypothetical protein